MKLYQIQKGTTGKLIARRADTTLEVTDWTTRKDLRFTEVLLDPVRLHNNRSSYDPCSLAVTLVEQGYAIFGGSDGGDRQAKYFLAVPYDQLKVE